MLLLSLPPSLERLAIICAVGNLRYFLPLDWSLPNLQEFTFTCYADLELCYWDRPVEHPLQCLLHRLQPAGAGLTTLRLNVSSMMVTDVTEWLQLLTDLSAQHPHLKRLLLWPMSISNSARVTASDITQCTHTLNHRWTQLEQLDLAVRGMSNRPLLMLLRTLDLPALLDLRLRIAGTPSDDLRDPVFPALPLPIAPLRGLFLSLGHRVHTHALLPEGQVCLHRLTVHTASTELLQRDVAAFVAANANTLESLTIHNVCYRPPLCDGARLVAAMHLHRCLALHALELIQPVTGPGFLAILCVLPPSLRRQSLWLQHDPSTRLAVRVPITIREVRLWWPQLPQSLAAVDWLGRPVDHWQVDPLRRVAVSLNDPDSQWRVEVVPAHPTGA